ncbi:hypothetical protein FC27_GL000878 [Companilactobacillus versmoldensis DSM 14857 = KCTC 3814]|uniref:Uncharacterized protein n=2 Tax=Companilactobacillus versmoldensis TaxID=194326 RepID=A0A0R1SN60_9LACO|nr:hypothetical protein FC27_GL000878 [Companilactobacillus versmoldensis DSM 14857 = KCTC 3814]
MERMNKVILNDFIREFNKRYDSRTFQRIEVINNDSLDQSTIFIKQDQSQVDRLKKIYSISPMNKKTVDLIFNAAAQELPFDGYYVWKENNQLQPAYIQIKQ